MSALSQDLYAAAGTPLSVVGSGGGGGGVPANPQVSTLSAFGITNLSSINGAPYVPGGGGSVPANLIVSTLTAASLVSTPQLIVGAGVATFGNTYLTASGLGNSTMNLSGPAGLNLLTQGTINLSGPGSTQKPVVIPGDLSVSSINGSPPALNANKVGTFNNLWDGFVTTGNAVWPSDSTGRLIYMSTTVGNSYRVDASFMFQPVQPSVTPSTVPSDNSIVLTVVSGGTNVKFDSIPTPDIYNISRGNLSSFRASYTTTFVAGATNALLQANYVSNDANAFTFTNSTIVSSLTAVTLTNLGVL